MFKKTHAGLTPRLGRFMETLAVIQVSAANASNGGQGVQSRPKGAQSGAQGATNDAQETQRLKNGRSFGAPQGDTDQGTIVP